MINNVGLVLSSLLHYCFAWINRCECSDLTLNKNYFFHSLKDSKNNKTDVIQLVFAYKELYHNLILPEAGRKTKVEKINLP